MVHVSELQRINRNNQKEFSSALVFPGAGGGGGIGSLYFWVVQLIPLFPLIAKLVNGYLEMPCLWKG